jgi:hypothetical protein
LLISPRTNITAGSGDTTTSCSWHWQSLVCNESPTTEESDDFALPARFPVLGLNGNFFKKLGTIFPVVKSPGSDFALKSV